MSLYIKKYGENYSKFHIKCVYTFDFIKFMSETLFYGMHLYLMGTIYYFKSEQPIKYQKLNKYNKTSSGGSCPQSTMPRSVAG